jgi:hypothetical protein
MKNVFLSTALLLVAVVLLAQKKKNPSPSPAEIKVPMVADRWQFEANGAEFITHKNVPAMKLAGPQRITLKNVDFKDGTIEYDVEPLADGFAGIYFHTGDKNETEYLYLRTSRAGNPVAMDAVQYAPYNKGVLLWDIFGCYQGPAVIKTQEWNHIKMIISGAQMLVFVNDQNTATLEIPQLEGNRPSGSIAFDGKCIVANVTIKAGVVDGLPARAGFDPTHHDPRYIRQWQVSQPHDLPSGKELYAADFPKATTEWLTVGAERRGLINLTREFGGADARRYVLLRTKVNAKVARKVRLSLGFSDDVWVYVNRQLAYIDKNDYRSPAMRKKPDGRISVENAQFEVPLKEGDNELLIGLANDFYGWGLMALINDLEGITTSVNFPKPPDPPKDMNIFAGTYKCPEFPEIIFSVENNTLMGKNAGQSPIALEYFETNKFKYEQAGIVVEFFPNDQKMVLTQGGKASTFVKQ